jgi:hypothetical protein
MHDRSAVISARTFIHIIGKSERLHTLTAHPPNTAYKYQTRAQAADAYSVSNRCRSRRVSLYIFYLTGLMLRRVIREQRLSIQTFLLFWFFNDQPV